MSAGKLAGDVRVVKAGRIINLVSKPTLADGSAGGIEPGSITFPVCRDCVDEFILVSESEIKEALCLVLDKLYMLIEGAAALAAAAFIKERKRFGKENVVLVITGKRIGLDKLKKIICSARLRRPGALLKNVNHAPGPHKTLFKLGLFDISNCESFSRISFSPSGALKNWKS